MLNGICSYLVFHGGSGSTPEEISTAVGHGVVKMNVDTDTQFAYLVGIRVCFFFASSLFPEHRRSGLLGFHHQKEGLPHDTGRQPRRSRQAQQEGEIFVPFPSIGVGH